ncbi:S24/S26 family peptidase [Euzebya tangerina]|uniref:S24/S26 family peptidase n=1 Tax=Euzebya tangerina TaxID=591198 RepID=UPI000E316664|nr:S24/S26 family peptidase [Euzebya tangerina]
MVAPDVRARLFRHRLDREATWIATDGASMGRRWQAGVRVLLEAVDRAPRRGEVWAYCTAEGKLVVHRYVRCRDGLHVFQGDASFRPDQPVPTTWLVGRVRSVTDGTRTWSPRRRHVMASRVSATVPAIRRRLRRAIHE